VQQVNGLDGSSTQLQKYFVEETLPIAFNVGSGAYQALN
jgi:hypothetical protein